MRGKLMSMVWLLLFPITLLTMYVLTAYYETIGTITLSAYNRYLKIGILVFGPKTDHWPKFPQVFAEKVAKKLGLDE